MNSRGALMGTGRTAVFLAVFGGARTVNDTAERTGLAKSVVHDHLVRLKQAGLVDWTLHRSGTLHVPGDWKVRRV